MLEHAARIIKEAEIFIITAGAGMGVDSGLPDFRGNSGFWKAYPAYARQGLSFVEAANPRQFEADPAFGWGFYGHRCNLYRTTLPHPGFTIIMNWIRRNQADYFVVTSNVDGQFQKAGYGDERILEVHGSIHHLQCLKPCSRKIWPNDEQITIHTATMRSENIPRCPDCGSVSRPNILMFGDYSWLPDRTRTQESRLDRFLDNLSDKRTAIIEIGAGTAIPTIRATSERLGWSYENATVIRINPREADIKPPHISLACSARDGLQGIDQLLST